MSIFTRWLAAVRDHRAATRHTVRGFPVEVANTRPDIATADVLARLDASLALIEQYTPVYLRHLRRDVAGIVVRRFPCRGAFFPETRTCLVELTFVVNPGFSLAQVASTILHEGMHARLHALGAPLEMADRARQERFCRRAEVEFGRLVPGGEAVVARALGSLASGDDEVAPDIDWALAAQRVAQVDADAHRR